MPRRLLIGGLLALVFVAPAAAQTTLMPGVTYERGVQFTPHGPVAIHVVRGPRPTGLYALRPVLSNETIQGVQWHTWPDVGDRPLVADMSSDILSRPLDAHKFALIYAGAQKNLGPAGATVVIVRQSWLDTASKTAPTMLRYATHAKNNSLYNTPPVFAVYLLNLVLEWIEETGGLEQIAKRNDLKVKTVYDAIDGSGGFYRGHAAPTDRSQMNITFRLPSEELEKRFITEATAAGMIGLAGHRSVGGIRASIYNAMSQEGAAALAGLMGEFARKNG